MKSFTTISNLFNTYIQNTSTANVALGKQLINDSHRYLLQKFFNNEFSTNFSTVSQQIFYPLPANYSKLKTVTITDGNLKWTPQEIFTRQDWDRLTVLPYNSNIPAYYFIWDSNTIAIWPYTSQGSTAVTYTGLSGVFTIGDTISDSNGVTGTILSDTGTILTIAIPSSMWGVTFATSGTITDTTSSATATISSTSVTAGLTMSFNYKIRVPDMTFADYTTGTVTMTSGSPTVTGSGSSWLSNYITTAGSAVNLNLYLQPTAPKGDNNWYPVSSIASATSLTLSNIYPTTQATQSGVNYTIGQMPLILEDFHDLLVYRPLMLYFSSIQKDIDKAEQFKALYMDGEERLAEYSGTKSVTVNLSQRINPMNPNLFWEG